MYVLFLRGISSFLSIGLLFPLSLASAFLLRFQSFTKWATEFFWATSDAVQTGEKFSQGKPITVQSAS